MEEKGSCLRKTRLWQKSQQTGSFLIPEVTEVTPPAIWEVSGGGAQGEGLARDGGNHTANPLPGLPQYCHSTTTVVPKDALLVVCPTHPGEVRFFAARLFSWDLVPRISCRGRNHDSRCAGQMLNHTELHPKTYRKVHSLAQGHTAFK